MIDIHTHILYDVDDGSDTIYESVALVKYAEKNGVTDIILTPHYLDDFDKERVYNNFLKLQEEVKKECKVNIYLGSEIAIYGEDVEQVLEGISLNETNYILVEYPMSVEVSYVISSIYELKLKGFIPIIAHPERCEVFKVQKGLLKEAIEEGAYVQCNTGSLLGDYGRTSKKLVKEYLKKGYVTFMATDTHCLKNERYSSIIKVRKITEKLVGKEVADKLYDINADIIIQKKK